MPDIVRILVFLRIAELSSFAAAPRSLKMPPTSATRIVAKLKDDLGQKLLERTMQQVALTRAGAIMAARFGPVVESFDQATRRQGDQTNHPRCPPDRAPLSFNAPMSMGLRLMPALINPFRLACPSIPLDVTLTNRLVDNVEESCDLAITISGPPKDKSTFRRKISEVPRHAIAAPSLLNA